MPALWLGDWVDGIRTLTIGLDDQGDVVVSVKDRSGTPYTIDDTGLKLASNKTINLKSTVEADRHKQIYLKVEAGSVGIGPTYKLYFVVNGDDGVQRLASEDDPIQNIRINPDIGAGLYDEWEEDLGVPWALPLIEYKKSL